MSGSEDVERKNIPEPEFFPSVTYFTHDTGIMSASVARDFHYLLLMPEPERYFTVSLAAQQLGISQQEAEQHTEGIKVNEVVVQLPDDTEQQKRLNHNQQCRQHHPLGKEAQNFFHPISPLFNITFIYLTIFFSFFQSSNEGHLPPDGPFG